MADALRIGIAGLGTVGASVVRLLDQQRAALALRCGRPIEIVAVSARSRGKNRGIDLKALRWFDDPAKLAADPGIDAFVELIGGEGNPARAAVTAALEAGKSVVTANKALLASHGVALAAIAEQQEVALNFEAAVAGAIPIIKTLREGLAGMHRPSVERLQALLRSHRHAPNGICSHPDPQALPMYARCTVASFIADVVTGQQYSLPIIRYWNAMVRIGMFIVVSLLLPTLRALEREKAIARMDDLTGAANRRHLFEATQAEINRSQRYKHPFAIAFIDLDRFKSFNDAFGHAAGDTLLRELGAFIRAHLRGEDIACRYGGEEFTLILPDADLEQTRERAEQLRQGARHLTVLHHGQTLAAITLSLGVAAFPDNGLSVEEILSAADAALYDAKEGGRDRVVVAAGAE